jgi:hypothetical protein
VRKNLILSVVGDESVHRSWLAGSEPREFDVALVYFGDQPGRYAADAEHYLERRGIKFELLHQLLHSEWSGLAEQYERIWIPDDDVAGDLATANRLFRIAAEQRLEVCQPAIDRGDMSFQTLRAEPGYLLRYSRFVEIMCPLFTRAALQKVLPLFVANRSAWGIDWVWSTWFGERELAVIDAAPMHHTRPLRSGGVHRRLAAAGIDPSRDHHDLMAKHGIDNLRFHRASVRGTARLRGLTLNGREVWTRTLWESLFKRKAG